MPPARGYATRSEIAQESHRRRKLELYLQDRFCYEIVSQVQRQAREGNEDAIRLLRTWIALDEPSQNGPPGA